MQIPFAAYADDCTVTGEIALESDRLSDFLASTAEFEVDGAAFRALDDGRLVETESAAIFRDDLCFVIASGPRGRLETVTTDGSATVTYTYDDNGNRLTRQTCSSSMPWASRSHRRR